MAHAANIEADAFAYRHALATLARRRPAAHAAPRTLYIPRARGSRTRRADDFSG